MGSLITAFDTVEAKLIECIEAGAEMADIKAFHRFTPGLYTRECRIPAGTLLVSECHKFEHPFVIPKGRIRVFSETEGNVTYEAPHIGITQPGTKRVLYAEEDTVWVTFHQTDETDVEKIGKTILVQSENPIIGDHPLLHQWLTQLPNQENTLT